MNLKNNELHRCFEADCDYCKPSIMEISHIIPLDMFIGPQMKYSQCTVAQLKDLLRERGLAVSGKKKELVSRLAENDEENEEEKDGEITTPFSWRNLRLYCPTHHREYDSGIEVNNRYNDMQEMILRPFFLSKTRCKEKRPSTLYTKARISPGLWRLLTCQTTKSRRGISTRMLLSWMVISTKIKLTCSWVEAPVKVSPLSAIKVDLTMLVVHYSTTL